jgi:hypothetical protein
LTAEDTNNNLNNNRKNRFHVEIPPSVPEPHRFGGQCSGPSNASSQVKG